MKLKKELVHEVGVFLLIGLAMCAVLFLASCGAPPTVQAEPAAAMAPVEAPEADSEGSRLRSMSAPALPESRPGLGTGWGNRISSSLNHTTFTRESERPFGGVAMIYYNDQEGIEAMAGPSKNKTSPYQQAADGAVEWGVKSGRRAPPHYMAGTKRYVVGKKGQAYSLVVKNVSQSRLEVVLSVDGLDVMDGRAASFKKRGYIIAPGEKIEVKGFRTSYDAVAAFEFSTVAASYSNLRHGQTRDVGVLGLVVFAEKGHSPWRWSRGEVQQRGGARPFAEAPLRTAR